MARIDAYRGHPSHPVFIPRSRTHSRSLSRLFRVRESVRERIILTTLAILKVALTK